MDQSVSVYESADGARIRIFANGSEVGDGAGSWIALVRPLVEGEELLVVQEIGACRGDLMFQAHVGAAISG